MNEIYKISDIANITGISIPTLRYYEKLGILKPERDSNNYRVYTDKELNWIDFIKRAKETGMTLKKIVEYSNLRERGDETINERIDILEQQEQLLINKQKIIQNHILFIQNKKEHYYEELDSKKS